MNVHRISYCSALRPLTTIAALAAAIAFSLLIVVAGGAPTARPRITGAASADAVLPATGSTIAGVVLLAAAILGIGAAVVLVVRSHSDGE